MRLKRNDVKRIQYNDSLQPAVSCIQLFECTQISSLR